MWYQALFPILNLCLVNEGSNAAAVWEALQIYTEKIIFPSKYQV